MPVPGRDTLVDVEGVIWMDRTATGAPQPRLPVYRPRARGDARRNWWPPRVSRCCERRRVHRALVPPATEHGGAAATTPSHASARDRKRPSPDTIRHARHRHRGARRPGAPGDNGTMGSGGKPPATGVTGTVVQKGSRDPVPYAIITLRGTNDSATADARGHFLLSPLVAGRYAMQVSDTALGAYAAERSDAAVVEVKRGEITAVHLELPSLRPVLAGHLQGPAATDEHGDAHRPDHPSAWRRARRHSAIRLAGGLCRRRARRDASNPGLAIINGRQTTTTDRLGRFVVCGVAMGRPVTLHFMRGAKSADTTFRVGLGSIILWTGARADRGSRTLLRLTLRLTAPPSPATGRPARVTASASVC